MSTVTASWAGDLRFTHSSDSGHSLATAAPADGGDGEPTPSPMELVLHALAGCTGIDVIAILRKMKEPVTGLEVRVEAERADKHPRIFTHLSLTYIIHGEVAEKKVARAIKLSEETYCSVSAMLNDKVKISSNYQILP